MRIFVQRNCRNAVFITKYWSRLNKMAKEFIYTKNIKYLSDNFDVMLTLLII